MRFLPHHRPRCQSRRRRYRRWIPRPPPRDSEQTTRPFWFSAWPPSWPPPMPFSTRAWRFVSWLVPPPVSSGPPEDPGASGIPRNRKWGAATPTRKSTSETIPTGMTMICSRSRSCSRRRRRPPKRTSDRTGGFHWPWRVLPRRDFRHRRGLGETATRRWSWWLSWNGCSFGGWIAARSDGKCRRCCCRRHCCCRCRCRCCRCCRQGLSCLYRWQGMNLIRFYSI
mmetsp:Transcript_24175/g.66978  ORF Transcript_24175/g.66978 Transcript_24175/m.66978 type:complete len:225 (-) Transcript_24175:17-691(-)